MKLLYQIAFFTSFFFVHNVNAQFKNDILKNNLKGNVKSFCETSYEAVYNAGKIQKGKKQREEAWEPNICIRYNPKGMVVENTGIKSNDELMHKYSYSYNNDSVLLSERIEYTANDSIYEKRNYKYDSRGNLTEEFTYNAYGNLINYTKNQYNESNQPIGITDYVLGNLAYISFYTYNESGKELEYRMMLPDSSIVRGYSNSYDVKGNVSERIYLKSAVAKRVYKYNSNNQKIEETGYFTDTEKMAFQNQYRYNKQGDLIETIWFIDNKLPQRGKNTYKYKYDKDGNFTEYIKYTDGKPTYIVERDIEYYHEM